MKRFILLLLVIFCSMQGFAQIRLSAIKVEDWIKKNFTGQGVVVGNITQKGYPLSVLSFTNKDILEIPQGLVLSTGNSYHVAGYNGTHNQSSAFTTDSQADPDLSVYIKEKLFDICSIEFDFVPTENSVQFNYQFGSDEYPEYVGSAYNDIFAFIISDGVSKKNIALVPESKVPVSINTINHKLNTNHYIDNNLFSQVVVKRQQPAANKNYGTLPGRVLRAVGSIFGGDGGAAPDRVVIQPDPELIKSRNPTMYRNLRYDGITKKMVAQAYVTPYKKYHLKIIIADVSDNIYDSGVFIEDRSLTAKKDVTQPGFQDYPDLSKLVDPNLILQGKSLEEILPEGYKPTIEKSAPQYVPLRDPGPLTEEPRPVRVQTPAKADAVALNNVVVNFEFDKSDVQPAEMEKLRRAMLEYQKVRGQYTFEIKGHTDSIGSLDYNMALSERRNRAVREAIREILGAAPAVPAQAKAFIEPVAENSTEEGRHANRRVEVIFKRK